MSSFLDNEMQNVIVPEPKVPVKKGRPPKVKPVVDIPTGLPKKYNLPNEYMTRKKTKAKEEPLSESCSESKKEEKKIGGIEKKVCASCGSNKPVTSFKKAGNYRRKNCNDCDGVLKEIKKNLRSKD